MRGTAWGLLAATVITIILSLSKEVVLRPQSMLRVSVWGDSVGCSSFQASCHAQCSGHLLRGACMRAACAGCSGWRAASCPATVR